MVGQMAKRGASGSNNLCLHAYNLEYDIIMAYAYVGNNPATSSDGTRGSVVLAGGQGREA
jgi:hypothetical protein